MRQTVVAAIFLSAGLVQAQQGTDELWEMTMSMQMEGMNMPPMRQEVCQPKGKSNAVDAVPMDKGCKMLEAKTVGTKTTFKVQCDGPDGKYTGTGEMNHPNKMSYNGKIRLVGVMDGEKVDVTQTIAGKRVGNCTYTDPTLQAQQMMQQAQAQTNQACDNVARDFVHQMFIATPNMPAMCEGQRASFCANVKKVGDELRNPVNYPKYEAKIDAWQGAYTACGNDPTPVRRAACDSANTQRAWAFIGKYCPQDAAALRQQQCAGRDYTSMDTKTADLCGALGFDGRDYTSQPSMQGNTGADPAASAAPPPAAAPTTTPPKKSSKKQKKQKSQTPDSNIMQEGAKRLKDLLSQ